VLSPVHDAFSLCSRMQTWPSPSFVHSVFVVQALKVKSELDEIRYSRENETGCKCKLMKMKMLHNKEERIKEEAEKRGIACDGLGRQEVHDLLHTVLLNEKCCSLDCPCSDSGIGCHYDVCGCFKGGEECGNAEGLYKCDFKTVTRYTKETLKMANEKLCLEAKE